MPEPRDIVVNLTVDTSKFEAAMRQAARTVRRLSDRINGTAWRQEALTRSLGQVTCPDDAVGHPHEFWIPLGYACPGCGAAL